ncbi:hypothetical protein [Geodermatophilus maliterrae]|uniref:Uncharacterized protein n=1 Tax=Geodermatophilus maliterrae TaxID=3162531 RepID=A0ABV3XEY5_9ACTN
MALSGRLGRIVAAGPVGGVADRVTVPDVEYADLTLAMRTGESMERCRYHLGDQSAHHSAPATALPCSGSQFVYPLVDELT